MTPKDYMRIVLKWNDDRLTDLKSNWERTRLSIYYSLQFKNPITYKHFCANLLPLAWDEPEEPFEITDDLRKQVFGDTPTPINETTIVTDMSQLKGLL